MRRLQIIQLPRSQVKGIRANGYTHACVFDAIREDSYRFVNSRIVRRMLARKTLTDAALMKLEEKTDTMSVLEATFWRLCRAHRLNPKTTTPEQLSTLLLGDDEFDTYMIAVHNVADRYIQLHAHLTLDFYDGKGVRYF